MTALRLAALSSVLLFPAALHASGPEEFLKAEISTASLGGFLKMVSAEPHVAGSPADLKLASRIAEVLASHGLEVSTSTYDVLLSYPEDSELDLVRPSTGALVRLEGERLPRAADLAREDRLPWNAYSPSADLRGEVVYANYGRPEDFEALHRMGISVRGRIVLARYGEGYRGGKSLEAERRGAAAILFYSDPADDGYVQGDEWPKGAWGPPDHFQRGANVYDFIVPGDPLTPGWASTPDARRINPASTAILPKIPSLPLAWREAAKLLASLEGPVAPKAWRGGVPVTYHVGPGPAEAHLKVKNRNEVKPIVNVLGTWRGKEEPEKLVFISSHHDAWTRGAIDDGIGTAILLELSRVFGLMTARGWKPRRTIVLASWDAEEYTLTGSTEWGEEHAEALKADAVAFLNVDAYRWGRDFAAISVPSLRGLIRGALDDVQASDSGGTLFDEWVASARARGEQAVIGPVGSGSDYTVFLNHLGVPAAETMFTGQAGAYHSIYDDYEWVAKVDPGFGRMAALARVNALMAWRLADDPLLPFDYGAYPRDIRANLKVLERLLAEGALQGSYEALDAWERAAARMAGARRAAAAADRLSCANLALMQLERDLLVEGGIPGRPWFKHLIYAPRPSYEAVVLPGIREALEADDANKAAIQVEILELALRRAAQTQEKAADCLRPEGLLGR